MAFGVEARSGLSLRLAGQSKETKPPRNQLSYDDGKPKADCSPKGDLSKRANVKISIDNATVYVPISRRIAIETRVCKRSLGESSEPSPLILSALDS